MILAHTPILSWYISHDNNSERLIRECTAINARESALRCHHLVNAPILESARLYHFDSFAGFLALFRFTSTPVDFLGGPKLLVSRLASQIHGINYETEAPSL